MTIETRNLLLVPASIELIETLLTDEAAFAKLLKVRLAVDWISFGIASFEYTLNFLSEIPQSYGWLSYFPIHKADRCLIGSGGYKGPPSSGGEVEIGYEIAPAYRRQGLATEMAQGLIKHAWLQPAVKIISAHTLATENHSARILRKCGFQKTQTIQDPDDGELWRWELPKLGSTL